MGRGMKKVWGAVKDNAVPLGIGAAIGAGVTYGAMSYANRRAAEKIDEEMEKDITDLARRAKNAKRRARGQQ